MIPKFNPLFPLAYLQRYHTTPLNDKLVFRLAWVRSENNAYIWFYHESKEQPGWYGLNATLLYHDFPESDVIHLQNEPNPASLFAKTMMRHCDYDTGYTWRYQYRPGKGKRRIKVQAPEFEYWEWGYWPPTVDREVSGYTELQLPT